MSSRLIEKRAWSMEGRLLLLFTAGATALLIGISVTLYAAVLHYMEGRADVSLEAQIDDAHSDLSEVDGVQDVISELADADAGETEFWLRVLDKNGKTLAQSHGMDERLPASLFAGPQRAEVRGRDYTVGDGTWMSLTSEAVTANGVEYTIQVAEDRHADRDFLRELRWILGGLIAAGVLYSAWMARMVTRRGLRPLKAMEKAVERVRATQLGTRLGKQDWPRELVPLATAFDDMMDRLEESFNRLSQFSADLAHELRTPIANLRGEAEVALSRGRTAEEYRHVIESSMEEYARLTSMAEKLLFLARADADEAEVKPEEIDGRAAIDALWEFYEPYADERGVHLKCHGSGQVMADAVLLRRAVANLIENALRFTPPGKEVNVEVAPGGIIRVTDAGSGIAPEHLPRLFDRFYQVDPARREAGAGLGLALVKSIMQLHGGSVAITSEPGRGTEATLRFPS